MELLAHYSKITRTNIWSEGLKGISPVLRLRWVFCCILVWQHSRTQLRIVQLEHESDVVVVVPCGEVSDLMFSGLNCMTLEYSSAVQPNELRYFFNGVPASLPQVTPFHNLRHIFAKGVSIWVIGILYTDDHMTFWHNLMLENTLSLLLYTGSFCYSKQDRGKNANFQWLQYHNCNGVHTSEVHPTTSKQSTTGG